MKSWPMPPCSRSIRTPHGASNFSENNLPIILPHRPNVKCLAGEYEKSSRPAKEVQRRRRHRLPIAYSNFALWTLKEQFGITAADADDLFAEMPPLPASDPFRTLLKRHLPLVSSLGSGKIRSKMIIAPQIVELREQSDHRIAIVSSAELSVDAAQGLYGFCDFLVSRPPTTLSVTAPMLAVVEAKREDLTTGVTQCIAAMYAASLFNARSGEPREMIYGTVTSGTNEHPAPHGTLTVDTKKPRAAI